MSLQTFLEDFNLDTLFAIEGSKETKEEFEIVEDSCSEENLVNLHNKSKFLFPSYLLRFGSFNQVNELDSKSLNVLLESGSVMAYEELKKRYGRNLSKAPDEFLVIGAQRNGILERDILTANYKSIIERIINRVDKRYYFKGQEKEDLVQEAFMGFLKAIEVYKVERRTKFKDFSHYVIQRHLGTLMNRSRNFRNRALNESYSYNMPVTTNNETTFEELIEGTNSSPEKVAEDKQILKEIKGKLTDNEREVFDFYSDGYTYDEIAYKLIEKKGQLSFDGMKYSDVSTSIKLFEAYNNAIDLLHKDVAKKATLEISPLIEELIVQVIHSIKEGKFDKEQIVELLATHLNELEFQVELFGEHIIASTMVTKLVTTPITQVISSEDTGEVLDVLVAQEESNTTYVRAFKRLKKSLEKEITLNLYNYGKQEVTYSEEKIAQKVISMDLQILKEAEERWIASDITRKFKFVSSQGLTWRDIAQEMKRKKKSVDNTIQRIRNKGNQHIEEFEALMKKELVH
ncbi:sigma-70 family RNA polymerase sigma factor [Priestia filamentosa]|uniref:sigma-70 family RNA polymerase sigma factor n=1 Tax=Priestia filamentosa TaxID=1402861 RepID=UPI00397BB759